MRRYAPVQTENAALVASRATCYMIDTAAAAAANTNGARQMTKYLVDLEWNGNVLSVDYPAEYQAYLKSRQAIFTAVMRDHGPDAKASCDRNSYGIPKGNKSKANGKANKAANGSTDTLTLSKRDLTALIQGAVAQAVKENGRAKSTRKSR